MAATKVSHPLFARMYERMAPAFEAKGGGADRDEPWPGSLAGSSKSPAPGSTSRTIRLPSPK